ncbi:hypothetical protein [uncultured Nostoc sp.]|uniref:hypothetical protein n=1 Tax=uncultured Nostoc sp. TaxID=340711 RepID=UPI0035CA99CA
MQKDLCHCVLFRRTRSLSSSPLGEGYEVLTIASPREAIQTLHFLNDLVVLC